MRCLLSRGKCIGADESEHKEASQGHCSGPLGGRGWGKDSSQHHWQHKLSLQIMASHCFLSGSCHKTNREITFTHNCLIGYRAMCFSRFSEYCPWISYIRKPLGEPLVFAKKNNLWSLIITTTTKKTLYICYTCPS